MKESHQRFLVWRNLKSKHKIDLTEEQVELIDNIYFRARLDNIKNVVLYRFVNCVFSIAGLILYLVLRETSAEKYVFLVLTALFGFYNFFYVLKGKSDHKRLKSKKDSFAE